MIVRRATRKLWAQASTLLELGELIAQWLEGSIDSQPGYMPNCGPDDETEPLIPVLSSINRAGFVTNGSQPGCKPEADGDGAVWCQRAAVMGWITDDGWPELARAATAAGLIVAEFAPGSARPCTIPATRVDGQDYTWFGGQLSSRDISHLYGELSDAGQMTLMNAVQLTIVDPEWGRIASPLWTLLESWAASRG